MSVKAVRGSSLTTTTTRRRPRALRHGAVAVQAARAAAVRAMRVARERLTELQHTCRAFSTVPAASVLQDTAYDCESYADAALARLEATAPA